MSEPLFVDRGTLLLSVPQMLDSNFMHTVVVMCDHSSKGAYGLVVNKRTELTVARLLPEHPVLGSVDLPVFDGGPVGRDALQILHRVPNGTGTGLEIASGLYLGGDLEALVEHVRQGPESRADLRLFLGYSGWGAGQLEVELVSGSWVPAPLDLELLFTDREQEDTWRDAMRGLGREGERLSRQPPDPTWN